MTDSDRQTRMLGCEDKWTTYDVKFSDGTRGCLNLNPARICHVREIRRVRYSLTRKPPFVRKSEKLLVRFHQLTTNYDWNDDFIKYTLNCSLDAFLDMLGVERRFNSAMLKADVKYGSHN